MLYRKDLAREAEEFPGWIIFPLVTHPGRTSDYFPTNIKYENAKSAPKTQSSSWWFWRRELDAFIGRIILQAISVEVQALGTSAGNDCSISHKGVKVGLKTPTGSCRGPSIESHEQEDAREFRGFLNGSTSAIHRKPACILSTYKPAR